MKQSNDGSLELGAVARVNGGGAEGFPHNGLADVRGDEERNARAKTIALLKQLIEQQNNQARNEQLDMLKKKNTRKHKQTWMMMSKQMPKPRSDGSPYMPLMT